MCLLVLHIEGWIHIIHVSLIQFLAKQLDCLTETLEMDNFPFTEEFNHVINIRIIT